MIKRFNMANLGTSETVLAAPRAPCEETLYTLTHGPVVVKLQCFNTDESRASLSGRHGLRQLRGLCFGHSDDYTLAERARRASDRVQCHRHILWIEQAIQL